MSKTDFGWIIVLGAVWGFAECVLGAALHSCASTISGSLMTGVALFFMAAAWKISGKAWSVALMIVLASGFKMFDALLLSLPIGDGAVANPLFAFLLEGAAFLAVARLVSGRAVRSVKAQALWGGSAALLAVAAFPLVKLATGIPACLAPGTAVPLSIYFAPLAVVFSALTVPIGFTAAEKIRRLGPFRTRGLAPSLSLAIGLSLVLLFRLMG